MFNNFRKAQYNNNGIRFFSKTCGTVKSTVFPLSKKLQTHLLHTNSGLKESQIGAQDERDTSGLTIHRGLPEGMQTDAARLYWDTFGRKFGLALGPTERGIEFIAQHLRLDRAVVALNQGKLVGLAGFHHAGLTFNNFGYPDVVCHYGVVSGTFRALLLSVLDRNEKPGELMLDGIVVQTIYRGRGIGQALLHEIAIIGQELGYKTVSLGVVDNNPGAKRLYERVGFRVTKIHYTPYLLPLMGFSAAATMVKELEPLQYNDKAIINQQKSKNPSV